MDKPSEHSRPHDHAAGGHHEHGPGCCGHDHGHEHAHTHEHEHEHEHGHGHAAGLAAARFPWSRLVPSFLLLLWGGVMIYYFASGRVVHYLTGFGGFRVQALICGLLLCVMAVFELLVREPRSHEHEHEHDHEHEHEHEHEGGCAGCESDDPGHAHGHAHAAPGGWLSKAMTFLILAVPLSAAALWSPDRYSDQFFINKANAVTTTGATALSGGGVDLAKRAEKSRPLPGAAGSSAAPANPNAFTVEELERLSGGRTPEGNIPLQLVELFYMPAQTRDVQEVVATQTVETTGQAIRDKQDPTKMRLFRLMMTCCAADARPISIPVEFTNAPPEWREMGWYKVTGTVEYRDINGTPTTVFKADSLTPSKPPRQQMMY